MKKGNLRRNWIINCTIVVISIFFSSICFANTYKWGDFTDPFVGEFKLNKGQNVTIEIYLPDFIVKNYNIVPLYIDFSIINSSSNYPSIQINESIWATYNLTTSKILNIKTKHLKDGINTIRFFLKRDTSERYSSSGATIREIRFDFAEIESLRATFSKKNDVKSRPAKSVKNKISDVDQTKINQQKQYNIKSLRTFNRSLNKKTRKYLQYALKHFGYYHGRIDGDFGPKTRQAIKLYQKKEGKVVTGYLDKKATKKLVQIGKVASENEKKKDLTEARLDKKPVKIEKKKSAHNQLQTKTDKQIQAKKTIIKVDQKDGVSESVNKTTSEKESTKQKSKRAEVGKHLSDGIIKTTDELEKRYKSLIDSFNLSINKAFYNQMLNAIESCNRTGYYVLGAFISQYLYMRFNDLSSMSQESSDSHQKAKLAEHFKNTRNQMIRYYNGSTNNKQALMTVLSKCEDYYQKTDTRSLLSKK